MVLAVVVIQMGQCICRLVWDTPVLPQKPFDTDDYCPEAIA